MKATPLFFPCSEQSGDDWVEGKLDDAQLFLTSGNGCCFVYSVSSKWGMREILRAVQGCEAVFYRSTNERVRRFFKLWNPDSGFVDGHNLLRHKLRLNARVQRTHLT